MIQIRYNSKQIEIFIGNIAIGFILRRIVTEKYNQFHFIECFLYETEEHLSFTFGILHFCLYFKFYY